MAKITRTHTDEALLWQQPRFFPSWEPSPKALVLRLIWPIYHWTDESLPIFLKD